MVCFVIGLRGHTAKASVNRKSQVVVVVVAQPWRLMKLSLLHDPSLPIHFVFLSFLHPHIPTQQTLSLALHRASRGPHFE